MEKYVIDLDRVLDELESRDNDEQNESKLSTTKHVQIPTNSLQNYYAFQGTSILTPYDKIDARDADFSIQSRPPKILNSIAILDSVNSIPEPPSFCIDNDNDKDNTNENKADDNLIDKENDISINVESDSGHGLISNVLENDLIQNISAVTPLQIKDESDSGQHSSSNVLENDFHESNPIQTTLEATLLQTNLPEPNTESFPPINDEIHIIEDIINQSNNISTENSLMPNDYSLNENEDPHDTTETITKEHLIEEHSENILQNVDEIDKLNNSSCDIETCDESIAEDLRNVQNIKEDSINEDLVNTSDDHKQDLQQETCLDTAITEDTQKEIVNDSVNDSSPIENLGANNSAELPTTLEPAQDLDINNMSEEELDRFLSDLEPRIEHNQNIDESAVNLGKCDEDFPNSSQNFEEEILSESVNSNAINQQNIENTVIDSQLEQINVEMLNCDSTPVPSDDLAIMESELSNTLEPESETVESLRPTSLTLQNASLNEAPQQSTQSDDNLPSTSADTTTPAIPANVHEDANRGGLVQNIAYFERQDMPNGLTEEEQSLGKLKPFWIPDEEAQNCLHCDMKFNLIKRRHHCRSCGKVLCSTCCNYKAKLMYLENKEARVCQLCYVILMRIEEIEKANGHPIDISEMGQATNSANNSVTINFPDPNNPAEYCSTISPFEQVNETQSRPPPTVMVPVGVLKRPGSSTLKRTGNLSDSSQSGERSQETVKQVIFSDGVRPGGDLVESPTTIDFPEERHIGRAQLQLKSPPAEKSFTVIEPPTLKRMKPSRLLVSDNSGINLPPIINYNELKTIDPTLPSKPTYVQLIECLRGKHFPWITFGLTKNLFVNVKLISKLCCNSVECWSFASRGLATVGQDEIFFCLDCSSLYNGPIISEEGAKGSNSSADAISEGNFPRDVFRLFTAIYDSASKASLYTELSHVFFPDGLFGNKENSGFIFTRPTLQCFQNVIVPSPPHLIAILIHKWEIPWAKVFPLRLILRLGFEYKTYPNPVISFANRKPVYFEIGHTIMNVLADFRNFQYTLAVVKDLVIHVEEKKRVTLLIPKLSYEKVCKVLSTSNEHVLAFGGNFSVKADSHFVCVQNEEDDDVQGQYHTQVASFANSPFKLTGASFVVFSGALKSSTGLKAKMNIVEDGLLVQIPPSTMEELRTAIRDMKEFKIDCCKLNETTSPDEWVQINWVNDELSTNLGVRSQIDGLNLEGVQSARIFTSPDYTNERYLIRWIEVFLLQINENSRRSEMLNTSRLAEQVSQAFCMALIDYLDQLYDSGLTKIGLRVSLDVDKVGYEAGSGGEQLPPQFTVQLDSALIPAIMENISTTGIEDPLVIELLFYILLK